MKVYFCDPQSPWQRGTNENTKLLLRQYFPKGTDLSRFTQAELDRVARRLNGRPRQTLGFKTPPFMVRQAVAMTGGSGINLSQKLEAVHPCAWTILLLMWSVPTVRIPGSFPLPPAG